MTLRRKRSQGQRLLRLIRLLENDCLTSSQLAEQLGCTQQEIQRDLRLLRSEGWAVQEIAERPKRYFLGSKALASPDPVRSVITHALLRMLHHHAPTPSRLYHRAATDLAAQLPDRLRQASVIAAPTGDTPRILEILATAWVRGEAVDFSYLKPGETRPKRSVGDIAFMEINRTNLDWYVFLQRRGEDKVKTFHLSRFTEVARRENDFSPPLSFNPEDELDGAWGVIGGQQHCLITLRFAPEALPWVTYRHWPGQIEAQREGHHYRLTVRAPLSYQSLPVEVLAWIRGWGPRVEVIAPGWVRELWLSEAREVLEKYGHH